MHFVEAHKIGGATLFNVYNNLEALCKAKGLTTSGLCVKCGVSKTIVARLRHNPTASLTFETAQKFADYLGVTTDEILHGKKEQPTDDDELYEYLEMLRQRPGMRALLKVHKGSTDEEIAANVRFIEELRNKHD